MVSDALVISDLHLGSHVCQSELLVSFLESVLSKDLPTRRLVLNGDVFDSLDVRLGKYQWKVLSLLRKLASDLDLVWVRGNHDGVGAETVAHLLGIELVEEHAFLSGLNTILCIHGHQWDSFDTDHPYLTALGDWCYRQLQLLDPSHGAARWAKLSSKTFLRCADRVRRGAYLEATEQLVDVVICGHTHHPKAPLSDINTYGPLYYNAGCWTERPCHYISVRDSVVSLQSYAGEQHEH